MRKAKISTMQKPERGEVWLVRFPFSDLTSTKLRPTLVLATHGADVIVMGIFSRVATGKLCPTWIKINDTDPAFISSGLQKTSLLKAEKIAVIYASVFQRKIGTLPSEVLSEVQEALKKALLIS